VCDIRLPRQELPRPLLAYGWTLGIDSYAHFSWTASHDPTEWHHCWHNVPTSRAGTLWHPYKNCHQWTGITIPYLIVTCDNNHMDPSLSTFFDSINNFSPWWIEHSNNPHKCTVCLKHHKQINKYITALTMYKEILPNLFAVLHVIRNQTSVLISLLNCKLTAR